MQKNVSEIAIPLNEIAQGLKLFIYEEQENTLFEISEIEAQQNGESPFQILEGRSYSYYFEKDIYQIKEVSKVINPSKRKFVSEGRITPNIYVGSMPLEIYDKKEPSKICTIVYVEVLPTKLDFISENQELDKDYRENYKLMLEYIAGKCSELLMQINSPVNQNFEPDFEKDNKTIYQRFAFVKSLLNSTEFNDAINKIIYSPSIIWKQKIETIDIRKTRRFTNSITKQIVSGSNRINFRINESIDSAPTKIENVIKIESVDTPENRFIKFALESFLKFCNDCENTFIKLNYKKALLEIEALIFTLQSYLEVPFFKEISRPTTLKLNSPILQRKSGYREVLNAWILFDLAAKLIWQGGDKVYKAGKRDIATLYEYWLFFQLYNLFTNNSNFSFDKITHDNKDISQLIEQTNDELGLKLKTGKETSLIGYYNSDQRKLKFRFSYNRTFSGNTKFNKQYGTDEWKADSGSWTKSLRPDYTFSFWPASINEEEAEDKNLIVHIHFDAKYKVKQFVIKDQIKKETDEDGEETDSLETEKNEERNGFYKNADLLKMHAYKDAIRRTGGAYVLYPGEGIIEKTDIKFKGFHEIIPGLGAFAVRPTDNQTGIENVSTFIDDLIKHFLNRGSQSEKLASKEYDIFKNFDEEKGNVKDPMPEFLDEAKQEKLIPDETFILVAYYKKENWDWILKTGLFNTRAGSSRGSLKLGPHESGAKYILLHSDGEIQTGKFFKVRAIGPRIFSRKTLERLNYPKDPKKQGQYYLVYKVAEVKDEEFLNLNWDITKLDGYKKGRGSAIPFSTTLTELMKVKIK
jgi:predicted component of viral defense system (DUF524 family)